MMPAGIEHPVLCVTCRLGVVTVAAYPEGCCAALGWAWVGQLYLRVSCTRGKKMCKTGLHLDACADAEFFAGEPKLTGFREGKTGRA
jgi:hypothetical protein